MNRALSQRLEAEVPKRLAELLAVPQSRVKVQRQPAAGRGKPGGVDLLVSAGDFHFVVECKAKGEAASVAMAARSVKEFAEQLKTKNIPLVAVPYMGEVGQRLCEEAEVCWLDLSGNAHLVATGLRVNIEGKPNQFKRLGRPRSLFAPKSSRIARWLLVEPARAFSQRELAKASGLDEGFTSRIVRQLEEQRLVSRDSAGAVKIADHDALLDAWREAYDFSKHHIVRGHIAARSSDEILRRVSAQLKRGQPGACGYGPGGRVVAQPICRLSARGFLRGANAARRSTAGDGFSRGSTRRERLAGCAKRRRCVSRRGRTRRHPLRSSGASLFGFEKSSRTVRGSSGAVAPEILEQGQPCLKNRPPPPVIHPNRSRG